MKTYRYEIRSILTVDKGQPVLAEALLASQETAEGAAELARQLAGAEPRGVAIVDTQDGTTDLRFMRELA